MWFGERRFGQRWCRSSGPSAWILSVCVGFVSGVWNWKSQVWLISFEPLFQSACALGRKKEKTERERETEQAVMESVVLWAENAEVGCCEKQQTSGERSWEGAALRQNHCDWSVQNNRIFPMLHCMIKLTAMILSQGLKKFKRSLFWWKNSLTNFMRVSGK